MRGMERLALVLACVLGCSPQGGATSDGGEGGASGSSCPSDVPASGAPCAADATCKYGGADGRCATLAACTGGAWVVTPPAAGCGSNDPSCPASFGALAAGSACPLAGAGTATCVYPEGACACTPCRVDGGTATDWSCRGFVTAGPDCPKLLPPIGSACSVENAFCAWSCCQPISLGPDETCQSGTWQAGACTAFCQTAPACP
jgi:hypothetical protein